MGFDRFGRAVVAEDEFGAVRRVSHLALRASVARVGRGGAAGEGASVFASFAILIKVLLCISAAGGSACAIWQASVIPAALVGVDKCAGLSVARRDGRLIAARGRLTGVGHVAVRFPFLARENLHHLGGRVRVAVQVVCSIITIWCSSYLAAVTLARLAQSVVVGKASPAAKQWVIGTSVPCLAGVDVGLIADALVGESAMDTADARALSTQVVKVGERKGIPRCLGHALRVLLVRDAASESRREGEAVAVALPRHHLVAGTREAVHVAATAVGVREAPFLPALQRAARTRETGNAWLGRRSKTDFTNFAFLQKLSNSLLSFLCNDYRQSDGLILSIYTRIYCSGIIMFHAHGKFDKNLLRSKFSI